MRHFIAATALTLTATAAAPAFAQDASFVTADISAGQAKPAPAAQKPPAKPKPKAPKLPVGYRAYFIVESTAMTASSTFNAVFGSSTLTGFGGGGEVLNLWKKIFARVAVSKASNEGARAFFIGGQLIPTGVPVEVGITTIELSAGWRQSLKKHPRFAFYGGGGMVFDKYSEQSQFAQTGEDTNQTFNGYSVFGGMEASVWKWVVVGVEGQFKSVADALGEGGLSKAYGENNLGGAAIRAMVGARFMKKK